ncbi:hypothetical protein BDK88_4208 [Natrinema hispanicum]|uniref:Uncharacterized protein n=1 Tax=Natrinema hispanicum TaxID=392421 RepID=A0A482Y6V8_9EURY|nr:hypothetical protein BDK88_4208 [Natrinema hispanicum]
MWAYKTGFDSCDTTSIFQNGYCHYLEKLEAATEETGSPDLRPGESGSLQATIGSYGGSA